jgi:hypothetical protein
MSNITSRHRRVSATKALELILAASDSEGDGSDVDVSNDASVQSAFKIMARVISRPRRMPTRSSNTAISARNQFAESIPSKAMSLPATTAKTNYHIKNNVV